jgi:hypothetical protein
MNPAVHHPYAGIRRLAVPQQSPDLNQGRGRYSESGDPAGEHRESLGEEYDAVFLSLKLKEGSSAGDELSRAAATLRRIRESRPGASTAFSWRTAEMGHEQPQAA